MPLYEYKCPVHNSFEQLMKLKDKVEELPCIFLDSNFEPCANMASIQVSVPAMQPDKHWAGTTTQTGKEVFSKKEYEEENRYLVPATEGNINAVRRRTVEAKQEKLKRHDKKVEHFLANELRGVTIEPDGNTVSERNKFHRMRHG